MSGTLPAGQTDEGQGLPGDGRRQRHRSRHGAADGLRGRGSDCGRGPARGRDRGDRGRMPRALVPRARGHAPMSRARTTSQSLVARGSPVSGRLDVAFNNAGFQERRAPLEEQGTDIYDSVFDTNVRALFLCLRHQLPAMLAQGRGSIVVNASVSGVRNPNPGFSLYSASKAAAISLTRSAAMENAPRGIRINAIAPGRVVTDMMLRAGVGDVATVSAGLPLRRMGSPEEVAEAVVWLSSDAVILCRRPRAGGGRGISWRRSCDGGAQQVGVVPAKAGTHNHREKFGEDCVVRRVCTRTIDRSRGMGPGVRQGRQHQCFCA